MKIKVEFGVVIPDGISEDAIGDWLRFETGIVGSAAIQPGLESFLDHECSRSIWGKVS